MAITNTKYDPNWREAFEHHDGELKRILDEQALLRTEKNEVFKREGYNSETMKSLLDKEKLLDEQQRESLTITRRCLDTYQHKTVQDAAKWLFDKFNVTGNVTSKINMMPVYDFEAFQTVDEVHEAWAEASEMIKKQDYANRNSLPTGQPNGMDIFEQRDDNQIINGYRHFSNEELCRANNQSLRSDISVSAPMTMDVREDGVHTSFSFDPDSNQTLINQIERLATAQYYQMIASSGSVSQNNLLGSGVVGKTLSKALAPIMNLASRINRSPNMADPSQFHFYIHVPPITNFQGEKFQRVRMDFEGGRFVNPRFEDMDALPKSVQTNYYKTKYPDTYDAEHLEVEKQKTLPAATKDYEL